MANGHDRETLESQTINLPQLRVAVDCEKMVSLYKSNGKLHIRDVVKKSYDPKITWVW